MTEELHIASLVVHSTPSRAPAVSRSLTAMPDARVHATAPNGKLVVTLQASSAAEMSALVSAIQHTEGVLSAALVYQWVDTLAAMNEEIPDADAPTGIH